MMNTNINLFTAAFCVAASVSVVVANGTHQDYNQELAKRTIRFILETESKDPAQVAVKSSLDALTKKNRSILIKIRQEGDVYSETDYLYDSVTAKLSTVAKSSEAEPEIILHLAHFSNKFDVHASGRKFTLYLNPELSYDPPKKK